LDYNAIILVFLFVFDGLVSTSVFATLLYVVLFVLAMLNVAPIRTPKLSGAWYYGITAYTLLLTLIYGWQLLQMEG
jgi:CDP-diacylglycerol--serine O-phosphatidyltransferase